MIDEKDDDDLEGRQFGGRMVELGSRKGGGAE